MKLFDMTNLFIARNKVEKDGVVLDKMTIAVLADDETEALDIAKGYGEDIGLSVDRNDSWEVEETQVDLFAINFDCDRIISAGDKREV